MSDLSSLRGFHSHRRLLHRFRKDLPFHAYDVSGTTESLGDRLSSGHWIRMNGHHKSVEFLNQAMPMRRGRDRNQL
jgi:hypothetical protein